MRAGRNDIPMLNADDNDRLQQPYASLFCTPAEHPFGNQVITRAYLLRRQEGNILLYSSSKLPEHERTLRALGGIRWQYLNHRDEASASCDWVWRTFEAPLFCHAKEREAVARSCQVHGTFDSAVALHPDLHAVPTPGHCPGSTCFLWEQGGRRFVFSGDTLYLAEGELRVSVHKGTPAEMIDSLNRIKQLRPDVLVPGLHIGGVSYLETSAAELLRRIDCVIAALQEDQDCKGGGDQACGDAG
jgi:hypothetical protein